jgi:hypothetical protein
LRECIECTREIYFEFWGKKKCHRKYTHRVAKYFLAQQGVLEQEAAKRAPSFPLKEKTRIETLRD